MSPIISVIIPAYNRSALVAECVQSILRSRPDVEVIVADDGSTDDTADVVRALGPRVTYFRQTNAGPAVARNAGFELSRGEYVTFLDSDDQWIAGGMSRLIAVLARHPDAPLVFGDASEGNPADGYRSFIETYGRAEFSRIPGQLIEPGLRRLDAGAFLRQLARRNVLFLGSLVMRRAVFERSGGFDPALCGAADWELFMRLASEYEFLHCEKTPASIHLSHAGCMSHDGDGMQQDFIGALAAVLRKATLRPGDRTFIEHELARHRFEWAYSAYDRGETDTAITRFAACVSESGVSVRALAYWMLSHLSSSHVRRLRSLKRAIAG